MEVRESAHSLATVAEHALPVIRLVGAVAVFPWVGIATVLAEGLAAFGLHAAACAVGADVAFAGVADHHSLPTVSGAKLVGIDGIEVLLELLLELNRPFGIQQPKGPLLDDAARRFADGAEGLVITVAEELLGVPVVDVVRMTTTIPLSLAQGDRWQTPAFAKGILLAAEHDLGQGQLDIYLKKLGNIT